MEKKNQTDNQVIIRTLNAPKNIINRIREKQANSLDVQVINEPALSM